MWNDSFFKFMSRLNLSRKFTSNEISKKSLCSNCSVKPFWMGSGQFCKGMLEHPKNEDFECKIPKNRPNLDFSLFLSLSERINEYITRFFSSVWVRMHNAHTILYRFPCHHPINIHYKHICLKVIYSNAYILFKLDQVCIPNYFIYESSENIHSINCIELS